MKVNSYEMPKAVEHSVSGARGIAISESRPLSGAVIVRHRRFLNCVSPVRVRPGAPFYCRDLQYVRDRRPNRLRRDRFLVTCL